MTPMTPPPMFGIFHISTVLVGTLLAVFFAKRAAKLPKDRIIRLFGILGLIMAFSELVKQLFYYYVVNDRQFDWWISPSSSAAFPCISVFLCLSFPGADVLKQQKRCRILSAPFLRHILFSGP